MHAVTVSMPAVIGREDRGQPRNMSFHAGSVRCAIINGLAMLSEMASDPLARALTPQYICDGLNTQRLCEKGEKEMDRHLGGQGRGHQGDQARTQPSGDQGRGHTPSRIRDHAVRPYIEHNRRQQEQTLPDHHQAPFSNSRAIMPSDRGSVPPLSASNFAESSRRFLHYVSLREAPSPDPDLQALLDPPPAQAHPESSRAGHSSDQVPGPLPGLIQMYRSLQRSENYLRQDTYNLADPPESFLRQFSDIIKTKKTLIQGIIRYLNDRISDNDNYLSTRQQEITNITGEMHSLEKELEKYNRSWQEVSTIGARLTLQWIQKSESRYTQLKKRHEEASDKYKQEEITLSRQNQAYKQKKQELEQSFTYYRALHEASLKYPSEREGQHAPSPDNDLLKRLQQYAWEPDPPAMINNHLLDHTIPGIGSNSLIHSLIRAAGKIPQDCIAQGSRDCRALLLQNGFSKENQMLTQSEISNLIDCLREQELIDGRAVKVSFHTNQATGIANELPIASLDYAPALPDYRDQEPIEIFLHQQTQHYSALLPETQASGSTQKVLIAPLPETQASGSTQKDLTAPLPETQASGSTQKDLTAETWEEIYYSSSVASNVLSENVHLTAEEVTLENVHSFLGLDVSPEGTINPAGTTLDSGHRGKRSLEQPPNAERDRSSKSRTRTTSIGKPFLPDLNQNPSDSALLPQTPRPTQPSPEVHQRLDPSQQRQGILFPDGCQLDIKNITPRSVNKACSYMARTKIYRSYFPIKNDPTDEQKKYLAAVKYLQAIEDSLKEGSYEDTHVHESIANLLTLASEIEDIRKALSMIQEKSQMPQPDTRRTNPRGTGAKKGLASSSQLVDISSDDEA